MSLFYHVHCPQCLEIMHGYKCDGCGYELPPPVSVPYCAPSALEIKRAAAFGVVVDRITYEVGVGLGKKWDLVDV